MFKVKFLEKYQDENDSSKPIIIRVRYCLNKYQREPSLRQWVNCVKMIGDRLHFPHNLLPSPQAIYDKLDVYIRDCKLMSPTGVIFNDAEIATQNFDADVKTIAQNIFFATVGYFVTMKNIKCPDEEWREFHIRSVFVHSYWINTRMLLHVFPNITDTLRIHDIVMLMAYRGVKEDIGYCIMRHYMLHVLKKEIELVKERREFVV